MARSIAVRALGLSRRARIVNCRSGISMAGTPPIRQRQLCLETCVNHPLVLANVLTLPYVVQMALLSCVFSVLIFRDMSAASIGVETSSEPDCRICPFLFDTTDIDVRIVRCITLWKANHAGCLTRCSQWSACTEGKK